MYESTHINYNDGVASGHWNRTLETQLVGEIASTPVDAQVEKPLHSQGDRQVGNNFALADIRLIGSTNSKRVNARPCYASEKSVRYPSEYVQFSSHGNLRYAARPSAVLTSVPRSVVGSSIMAHTSTEPRIYTLSCGASELWKAL